MTTTHTHTDTHTHTVGTVMILVAWRLPRLWFILNKWMCPPVSEGGAAEPLQLRRQIKKKKKSKNPVTTTRAAGYIRKSEGEGG